MSEDSTNPPGEAPKKRRPKDSEFFELPPDLKRKMAPGELPIMATSSSKPKPGADPKPKGGKGCLGVLAGLAFGGGALVAWLA